MIKLNNKSVLFLIAFFIFGLFPILGKNPLINKNKSKYAISGYDSVAYFTEKRSKKGNKKYRYQWKKAQWLFSNKKNLQLFKKNPKKYAPQYGGYCAFAVSKGFSERVSPEDSWTIYNNKLYLNYNRKIYRKWHANTDSYIKKANKAWPNSLKKNSPG